MVTLAHKMLHTIYAMLTNGNHCEDKQVGYEAFNVQRNAPAFDWVALHQMLAIKPDGDTARGLLPGAQ